MRAALRPWRSQPIHQQQPDSSKKEVEYSLCHLLGSARSKVMPISLRTSPPPRALLNAVAEQEVDGVRHRTLVRKPASTRPRSGLRSWLAGHMPQHAKAGVRLRNGPRLSHGSHRQFRDVPASDCRWTECRPRASHTQLFQRVVDLSLGEGCIGGKDRILSQLLPPVVLGKHSSGAA